MTPSIRRKLKKPLGTLIEGSFNETLEKLQTVLEKECPVKIVTVGDAVLGGLTKINIKPDISIIDNKIMRKPIAPSAVEADEILYASNPPGTITDEAWNNVKKAVASNKRVKIVIEGEEDLLTLIAILEAPENSLVIYGQPKKGVVTVPVTSEKKKEMLTIINAMSRSKD